MTSKYEQRYKNLTSEELEKRLKWLDLISGISSDNKTAIRGAEAIRTEQRQRDHETLLCPESRKTE
jgi:hypothetical protein